MTDPDIGEADAIDEFYVDTPLSMVERVLHSLKEGDRFAVLDSHGDIGAVPETPEGLFLETRDTFRDLSFASTVSS